MKPPYNKSSEWYTPDYLLNLVYSVMEIDLDPASPEVPNVKAKQHYTKNNSGLINSWHGNIYLNPPYGSAINQWISKLISEWTRFNIKNAIILIPAKTDTRWFNSLAGYAVCFCTVIGRIRFLSPNIETPSVSGTFPSMFVLLSQDKNVIAKFFETFSSIGFCWEHMREIKPPKGVE